MKHMLMILIFAAGPAGAETPEVARELAGETPNDAARRAVKRAGGAAAGGGDRLFDGGADRPGGGDAPREALVIEGAAPVPVDAGGVPADAVAALEMSEPQPLGRARAAVPSPPLRAARVQAARSSGLKTLAGPPRDCAGFFDCLLEGGRSLIAAPIEGARSGFEKGAAMGSAVGGIVGAVVGSAVGTYTGLALGLVLAPIGLVKNVGKAIWSLFD